MSWGSIKRGLQALNAKADNLSSRATLLIIKNESEVGDQIAQCEDSVVYVLPLYAFSVIQKQNPNATCAREKLMSSLGLLI